MSALALHTFSLTGTALRVHCLLTALRAFTAMLPTLHRDWPTTVLAFSWDSEGSGLAVQQDCIMTDIWHSPNTSTVLLVDSIHRTPVLMTLRMLGAMIHRSSLFYTSQRRPARGRPC